MKTRFLISAFGMLFFLSIMFTDADARCLEDPCYYYQPPRVIDADGNTLDFVMVDQQVRITIDVANGEDYEQPFVALIQVVDENNFPVSLNWISGVLDSGHSFSPTTSWIPKKSGYYEATVYLWESLERTIPLFPVMATSIDVMSKNDLRKIQSDLIECKDNLVLLQKHDGSTACVKQKNFDELIYRNWGQLIPYNKLTMIDIPSEMYLTDMPISFKVKETGWGNPCNSMYLSIANLDTNEIVWYRSERHPCPQTSQDDLFIHVSYVPDSRVSELSFAKTGDYKLKIESRNKILEHYFSVKLGEKENED